MNYDDFVPQDSDFLKKYGNIFISDRQNEILKKYDIIVDNYKNAEDLIYDIENVLNDSYETLEDLEWVSQSLSEYNYYNNTNK